MTVWRETTLAEVSDQVDYGYTASAIDDPNVPRYVRITDIVGPYVNWSSVPGCVIDGKRLEKFILRTDDIVVARTGATVGHAKRVRRQPESVFASYLVRFRLLPEVDPGYVGAVIESQYYKNWVLQHAGGAAQPNANAKVLGAFPFLLPDRRAQQRIGRIFDAIDDLIENNRQRIELLEHMAQAIYREWFVHFRYPGHEDATIVHSPLGPIPEGWEVTTVAGCAKAPTRGISPKYADDGAWTVLNQKCIRNQRVSLERARRQERAVPPAKQVQFGDVLINSTGVGTLGRIAIFLGDHPALTVDSHVTLVRPCDPLANPWFGMNLLGLQAHFESLGTGSTGQTELSRKDIGATALVRPPPGLRRCFAESAWPMLTGTTQLLEQNRCLAGIRNLLLPKLVTGQIDVSELDLDALTEPVA